MPAPSPIRTRLAGGLAALLLQALLGYALIAGFTVDLRAPLDAALEVFDIPPPAAPAVEPPRPRQAARPRPAAAAAPPARRAAPTAIVVPETIVPVIDPPPLVTAPVAGLGGDPSAGASALPGPGTGDAGEGSGTGSGDAGVGDGGGGGTPARWLRGRIRDTDYPREAYEAGLEGEMTTRYAVAANGRVTACTVIASSRSPMLDAITCRLVIERYRYRPARDAAGRKVPGVIEEDHRWVIVE